MSQSKFQDVQMAPVIEIFAINAACVADPHKDKVNLSVGAYRDDNGQPWVLPVVRQVEKHMAEDASLTHEYLPVSGMPDFCTSATRLIMGDLMSKFGDRVGSVQAPGGTGALSLAIAFLKRCGNCSTALVSKPTWGNHIGICKTFGYDVKEYKYWDQANRCVDMASFTADLKAAPENSVVILHACAHNPTGMDPTRDQWKEIATVCKEKNHFPLFDCAYQGFATGDIDGDAWAIRYFAELGFELMVAQSFSKNFGLYNERVGNLIYLVGAADLLPKITSQLKIIIRQNYSNPPNHGARIVATSLNNAIYRTEWEANVKTMAERIKLMRQMLYEKLRTLGTPGTWTHILQQTGMFSFTGLSEKQCEELTSKYHIYLLKTGRINMCGLTTHNIDYVAQAIHDVVTTCK